MASYIAIALTDLQKGEEKAQSCDISDYNSSLRAADVANPVIIEDYDTRWPQVFEMLRSRVSAVLN